MKGTCPKCGTVFHGLALENTEHQQCDECGTRLIIKKIEDYDFLSDTDFIKDCDIDRIKHE